MPTPNNPNNSHYAREWANKNAKRSITPYGATDEQVKGSLPPYCPEEGYWDNLYGSPEVRECGEHLLFIMRSKETQ